VFPIHLLGHLVGALETTAYATATGTTVKHVQCEACGFEFVYQLRRTVHGRATSFLIPDHQAAWVQANENLRHALATACDPVPCPLCGWLQRPMVRRARQLKYRRLWLVSLLLVVAAAILGAAGAIVLALTHQQSGPIPWPAGVLFLLAGAALAAAPVVLLKFILAWSYDPNDGDVESRIELGCSCAVGKKTCESGTAHPPNG
jgi:hypothetical protein